MYLGWAGTLTYLIIGGRAGNRLGFEATRWRGGRGVGLAGPLGGRRLRKRGGRERRRAHGVRDAVPAGPTPRLTRLGYRAV